MCTPAFFKSRNTNRPPAPHSPMYLSTTMSPNAEKESFSSEKTTPHSSTHSSRSASPRASRHHKKEYRDFPQDYYHFSRGHMPPPPPHDFGHPPFGHPHYVGEFGHPPHMRGMHPKDPFFAEFAHKPKRSPLRKALVVCVACLAGASVFTLGRGYEAHRINTALNGEDDCGQWLPTGISELTWAPGSDRKFPEHHKLDNHRFEGKPMKHGKHGRHPPPHPPIGFMEWEGPHGVDPKKHHGKHHEKHHEKGAKHHDRPSPPSLEGESSDESDDEIVEEHVRHSRKHSGGVKHEREASSEGESA